MAVYGEYAGNKLVYMVQGLEASEFLAGVSKIRKALSRYTQEKSKSGWLIGWRSQSDSMSLGSNPTSNIESVGHGSQVVGMHARPGTRRLRIQQMLKTLSQTAALNHLDVKARTVSLFKNAPWFIWLMTRRLLWQDIKLDHVFAAVGPTRLVFFEITVQQLLISNLVYNWIMQSCHLVLTNARVHISIGSTMTSRRPCSHWQLKLSLALGLARQRPRVWTLKLVSETTSMKVFQLNWKN